MGDLICEWVHIVDIYFASALKYYVLGKNFKKTGLGLWCSMPLSTIFHNYVFKIPIKSMMFFLKVWKEN